jgi:hypothetical protein|tara:strand:+ start:1695 stop:2288 length:594 start_codon:yes stop_codon:yes gene_type:complete
MKRKYTIIGIILVSFIVGCATKPEIIPPITPPSRPITPPKRVEVPPSDEFTLYARGLSTGMMREEDADRRAALSARNELATSIETHIKSLTKDAMEQIGMGKDADLTSLFSSAIKATVDQTLRFSVLHSAKPTIWDERMNGFRAEVVYKLNIGPINEQMLDNIKQRKNLYEQFRASELFNELEDEIEKQRGQDTSGQ